MRISLLITIAAVLAGCTFTLVGNAPKTETSVAQNKTINATFAKSEQFVNACAAYLFVSILSLGLYVPENVTWWCGSKEPECKDGDTSEDCQDYVPKAK